MTDSNTIYANAIDGIEGQYLVYVLYRDEGIPHYVGATKDSRRPYSNRHKARHGHNVTSVEIVQECMTLEDAGNLEGQLINTYGRQVEGGTLVNVKGGGHGLKAHTDETKLKISMSHKGKTLSDEHIAKVVAANKGVALTEERKAKISLAHKGRTKSEETKLKMSLAKKEYYRRRRELSLK